TVTKASYSILVQTTDQSGATGTSQLTITVPNVAPVVTLGDSAFLAVGDEFTATGSFTDPDANTWTATVNYGDGDPTSDLTLDGKSFTLSHTYTHEGTFNVVVTVTDGPGASDSAAQLVFTYVLGPTASDSSTSPPGGSSTVAIKDSVSATLNHSSSATDSAEIAVAVLPNNAPPGSSTIVAAVLD